jgi:hypothetical protein
VLLWAFLGCFTAAYGATAVSAKDVKLAEERFRGEADRIDALQRAIDQKTVLLDGWADVLEALATRLRKAAEECQRVVQDRTKDCTVSYKQSKLSISQALSLAGRADKTAALCKAYSGQTKPDRTALQTQLKVVQAEQREFGEWKVKNEKSIKDALLHGIPFIFTNYGGTLEAKSKSVSALKGWVTRYERQLAESGVSNAAIFPKLEAAYQRYANAALALKSAQVVDYGKKADDLWDEFKNVFSVTASKEADSDGEVRAFIQNPKVQKLINDERPDVDLQLFATETTIKVLIPGASPIVEVTDFAINFGYDATAFWLSYKQILQQADLANQSALAVASLKKYLDRKEEIWPNCFKQLD